ncbi:hypothetical protein GMA3_79 [Gordonia phage GMA3]|uniref:Uncharacterized protein n=1 Tax=Gordonia phage GMA3 TaxID=1647284 RepID=A0A0K0NKM1_9CAUD|nr:hypothetical protein AU105_gp079 [Gordonia phage GMA3]AKL88256.1 hypothetical protein GMA3_79 [Gordonia phage GMA3]
MENERLYDDSIFYQGEGKPVPYSLGQLINNLEIGHLTKAEQEPIIQEWLDSNSPSEALMRSIQRRGYCVPKDGD